MFNLYMLLLPLLPFVLYLCIQTIPNNVDFKGARSCFTVQAGLIVLFPPQKQRTVRSGVTCCKIHNHNFFIIVHIWCQQSEGAFHIGNESDEQTPIARINHNQDYIDGVQSGIDVRKRTACVAYIDSFAANKILSLF